MALYYDFETESGVYKVKRPMGRIGAIHFGIITKYMPANKKEKDAPLSPMEQERIADGFEVWAAKVLPNILVSFTPKGAPTPNATVTIDDMSGEDQYAMFIAVSSQLEVSESFFRLI